MYSKNKEDHNLQSESDDSEIDVEFVAKNEMCDQRVYSMWTYLQEKKLMSQINSKQSIDDKRSFSATNLGNKGRISFIILFYINKILREAISKYLLQNESTKFPLILIDQFL